MDFIPPPLAVGLIGALAIAGMLPDEMPVWLARALLAAWGIWVFAWIAINHRE